MKAAPGIAAARPAEEAAAEAATAIRPADLRLPAQGHAIGGGVETTCLPAPSFTIGGGAKTAMKEATAAAREAATVLARAPTCTPDTAAGGAAETEEAAAEPLGEAVAARAEAGATTIAGASSRSTAGAATHPSTLLAADTTGQETIVDGNPPTPILVVGGDTKLDPMLEALLRRQIEDCPRIFAELERHGRKTSHWAWWVFPTDLPGASEPPPATCVTHAAAPELLRRAPGGWRIVLQKVAELAAAHESGVAGVIPSVDLGRVASFVKFWSTADGRPPWLDDVLAALDGTPTGAADEPDRPEVAVESGPGGDGGTNPEETLTEEDPAPKPDLALTKPRSRGDVADAAVTKYLPGQEAEPQADDASEEPTEEEVELRGRIAESPEDGSLYQELGDSL